jgi:hypothetical protein
LTPSGGESWQALSGPPPNYAAIGTADYNGDGISDIMFRNSSTGNFGYMALNGTGGESWHSLGNLSTAFTSINT